MRFTIQREAFLRPLRLVAGGVDRKQSSQSSPILLNTLLQVQDDHFSLTTTDQEIELVAIGKLEMPAEMDGAVTVSVRKLMEVCKTLPEGVNISFVEAEDRITLRAGRSRFMVSTLPVCEFPNLDEQVGKFKICISKKNLRLLIEQTCFAMAEQDVRYYLNGMLLEVNKDEVYGVAADGHRLALGKAVLGQTNSETFRVIVPRKGILELQRILDDTEEEIQIILGSNHIRVVTNDVQLTSKLLEGRFPDYNRIVLTDGDKVFTGCREVLKDAFQRAAALFSDRFRGVRLRLTEGYLKILAISSEQDEVEEDVEVDYVGNELEIGFNVKYLIDLLNVIQTERVKFTLSDSNNSARVEGVGAQSGIYVIMPMKI
ncbi:MAG TPA: DNA polymerase III subunit beta [Gammaproteobacteria bacterium]|nr:DNA polymerase III subunit beta [Gammaproteobacteria bacterium]